MPNACDRMVDLQLDIGAAFMDARVRRCGAEAQLVGWIRSGYSASPGLCAGCGSAIHPARLQAVPTAARCTPCQDKHDRQGAKPCRR